MNQHHLEWLARQLTPRTEHIQSIAHGIVDLAERPGKFAFFIENVSHQRVRFERGIRTILQLNFHVSLSFYVDPFESSAGATDRSPHPPRVWLPCAAPIRGGRGTSCLSPWKARTSQHRRGNKSLGARPSCPFAAFALRVYRSPGGATATCAFSADRDSAAHPAGIPGCGSLPATPRPREVPRTLREDSPC